MARTRRRPVAVAEELIRKALSQSTNRKCGATVAKVCRNLRRAGKLGKREDVAHHDAVLRRFVYGGEPIRHAIESEM